MSPAHTCTYYYYFAKEELHCVKTKSQRQKNNLLGCSLVPHLNHKWKTPSFFVQFWICICQFHSVFAPDRCTLKWQSCQPPGKMEIEFKCKRLKWQKSISLSGIANNGPYSKVVDIICQLTIWSNICQYFGQIIFYICHHPGDRGDK